jgi:hypothetical protein
MTRSASTLAIAALTALTATGCCCALGGRSPEEEERLAEIRAELEEERSAARENALGRAQRVSSIAPLIDPSAVVPRRDCPDAVVEERLGEAPLRHRLPTASYRSLTDPDGEVAGWRWLNHGVVGDWQLLRRNASEADDEARRNAGARENRLLVVFVDRDRALPRIDEEDGLLGAGSFTGGHWDGGLYVVDLDEPQVLCSAPFHMESSDSVDGDEDFDEALSDDFRGRFETSADEALQGISRKITVDVHGIL